MKAYKDNHPLPYVTLSKRIEVIHRVYNEKKQSPTISEIAIIVGHSEEYILESLEFGRDHYSAAEYVH